MTTQTVELRSRNDHVWMLHGCLSAQNFEQSSRNTLSNARGRLARVKKTLVQIVAQNLKSAMEASEFDSYRALGRAAGVAPNTVKNLAEPDTRALGPRGETSPRLDVLDKIASAMGFQGWHLMQEQFDPANPPARVLTARESEWHSRVEKLYRELPPDRTKEK